MLRLRITRLRVAKRPGSLLVTFLSFSLILAGAAKAVENNSETEEPSPKEKLQKCVNSYFKAESSGDRRKALSEINKLEEVTVDAVSEAIKSVDLWDAASNGLQQFDLKAGKKRIVKVHARVPKGYDHKKAYPLLLAFHGRGGRGDTILGFATNLLGDRVDEFIVAAPTDYRGCFVGSPEMRAGEPLALLDGLKHCYHIDTDRIYIVGYSMGGYATFGLSILHTDQLAGAVPLAGTFSPALAPQLMDVMLPNLRHLPMLIVYGETDQIGAWRDSNDASQTVGGIASANRRMADVAKQLGVPLKILELAGVGHMGVSPSPSDFLEVTSQKRPHRIAQIDHWFRFEEQGRMCWLRQKDYLGTPWQASRLAVEPALNETREQAIIATLQDKLAYIGGTIEGQVIRIKTNRCASIEVLLNDELVDLDQDITIYVDGKMRLEGKAKRRISTLLELAQEDWDFQRLWPVRIVIPDKGRARQE